MTYRSPYVVGVIYLAVYTVFSLITFGSVFKPIGYLLFWDFIRLPQDVLVKSYAFGIIAGLLVYLILHKMNWALAYKLGASFLGFISVSIIIAASISGDARAKKIVELGPDKVITNSFINSLHNTPRDFQLYTHAVALKNCQPYAWSYRELDFYELRESVARNVVPAEWREECNKALSERGDNE